MSFFTKLEQFCASFVERTFAKTFPSDLEPAQIARKLVSMMEGETREDDGRLHAPGSYAVYVSPSDFERLAEHQKYLERAWADLLRDLAGRFGVVFEEKPRVVMAARTSVPLGAIEIEIAGPAEPAKSYSLRTLEGVPPNGVYALERTSTIGRSEESTIVLLDPGVSRAHAVIEIGRGPAVVRDLGSTNGTFVNGRRIERERLRDGDELRFGNTRMRFEGG
ncbi:MAG TPA: FhaA domain-containing protein [Candidatus Nitrosotalea sp.]|nr:FhaA domain-containing protein [Candidatus Nitrosotalea sp.]